MARLPKSIIKKYGISKKAWNVYRGKKRTKKKRSRSYSRIKKRRVRSMPRRKKRSFRRSSKSGGVLMNEFIGGAGTVAYDRYLAPMLPISDPMLRTGAEAIGAHMFLAKRGGMLGKVGRVMRSVKITKFIDVLLGGNGL